MVYSKYCPRCVVDPPIPPKGYYFGILQHSLDHGQDLIDFDCIICESRLQGVTSLEAVHHYTEHLRTRALTPSVIEWLSQHLPRPQSNTEAPATTTVPPNDQFASTLTEPIVDDVIDSHESLDLPLLHPNDGHVSTDLPLLHPNDDIDDESTIPVHDSEYDDVNMERQSNRSMTMSIEDAISQTFIEEPEDVLYLNPSYHYKTEY